MASDVDDSARAAAAGGAAASARSGFVGRTRELATLLEALRHAAAGNGSVAMLVGEAGIGKTRTAAEFAARARGTGALVLRGGCYDGEWAPPYGPFAQALTAYVHKAKAEDLHDQLGAGAAWLTAMIPALRERMPDLPPPLAVQPDEERFRVFDAVSRWLIRISAEHPLVLFIDDLHWADAGTIGLLRHLARGLADHAVLVVCAYRDDEVEALHTLSVALRDLRRQATCASLPLQGLSPAEGADLVTALAPEQFSPAIVAGIIGRTHGNPLFIGEMVQHLLAAGASSTEGGSEVDVPEGIRQVIARRLQQLSDEPNQLLIAAAAFEPSFSFEIAAAVAALTADQAMDAVDVALRARLIEPAGSADAYQFSHALIRQTLYSGMNPSRRARLHRRVAETMESVYGDRSGEHAAEIAHQYQESRDLPGAHRGVDHALVAAARAEVAAAYGTAAAALRTALDLLPPGDSRRPRLLGRLGLDLAWAGAFDDAVRVVSEAAQAIALNEDHDAAARYLADSLIPMWDGGSFPHGFALARSGLLHVGARRDRTWAELQAMEIIRQEVEGGPAPAKPRDTPERREVTRIFAQGAALGEEFPEDLVPSYARVFMVAGGGFRRSGDYRNAAMIDRRRAMEFEARGRLAEAGFLWARAYRLQTALGECALATDARDRACGLARRLDNHSVLWGQVQSGDDEWRMAFDETPIAGVDAEMNFGVLQPWLQVGVQSVMGRWLARFGMMDPAIDCFAAVLPALQDPPAWMCGEPFVKVACDAAEILWWTGRADGSGELARLLRESVIDPDLHHPMMDGRLALARLSALQGHYDASAEWFGRARTVLDAQGARPLRAIVDYDEAQMCVRRGAGGDAAHAEALLDSALAAFHSLGMRGWIARVTSWRETSAFVSQQPAVGSGAASLATHAPTLEQPQPLPTDDGAVFRREGDYWMVGYRGTVVRLRDSRGMQYLWDLVRYPGEEFLALDLVVRSRDPEAPSGGPARIGDQGLAVLDATSKAAYKRRLVDLRETLADAEAMNDRGTIERAQAEIDFIVSELTAAVGLGGRDRRPRSHAERARSTVTKGIKSAIARINATNPSLGRHFDRAIRTGVFCTYRPDPEDLPRWQL